VINNRFLNDSEGRSPNVQLLELAAIRCDCGTQIRAEISESTVAEYAEAMESGADFPPLIVFHDGNRYLLADGFHRLMAASRRGRTEFHADVRQGTKSDALRFALQANALHGLKRTNADKRRSIELALAEWPQVSDRQIAELCAVGYTLVAEVRKAQLPETGSWRLGADGKQRRVPLRVPPARKRCKGAAQGFADAAQPIPAELHDGILSAQVETNYDELRQIVTRPHAAMKQGVSYHLNVMQADAEIIAAAIHDNTIAKEQLLSAAVQMRLCVQLMEELARKLSIPNSN